MITINSRGNQFLVSSEKGTEMANVKTDLYDALLKQALSSGSPDHQKKAEALNKKLEPYFAFFGEQKGSEKTIDEIATHLERDREQGQLEYQELMKEAKKSSDLQTTMRDRVRYLAFHYFDLRKVLQLLPQEIERAEKVQEEKAARSGDPQIAGKARKIITGATEALKLLKQALSNQQNPLYLAQLPDAQFKIFTENLTAIQKLTSAVVNFDPSFTPIKSQINMLLEGANLRGRPDLQVYKTKLPELNEAKTDPIQLLGDEQRKLEQEQQRLAPYGGFLTEALASLDNIKKKVVEVQLKYREAIQAVLSQAQTTNIVNLHLIEILQHLDSTGRHLPPIDEITIKQLNALTWNGTEVIQAASDPGPVRERKDAAIESKRSGRPRTLAAIEVKDDLELKPAESKGTPVIVEEKAALDLAAWESERRQLKTLLGFLNDSELTYIQNENARLRKIYARVKDKNKTLFPEALQELTAYEARAEESRTQEFNALLPGHHKVVEALAYLDSRRTTKTLELLFQKRSDIQHEQTLRQIHEELENNAFDLFGTSGGFLFGGNKKEEKSVPQPKKKAKKDEKAWSNMTKKEKEEDAKRLAQQQDENMTKPDPEKVGQFLATRSALLDPNTLQLLQQRRVILDKAIKSVKNSQTKNIFKKELAGVNDLIADLQHAISKQKMIDKKVAELVVLQADICQQCMPILNKSNDFLDKLNFVAVNLPEIKFLYKHANNYAAFAFLTDKHSQLSKALADLKELEQIFNAINSVEKTLYDLEKLDPHHRQIAYFKSLLSNLHSYPEKGKETNWQQVGGLATRWHKFEATYDSFRLEYIAVMNAALLRLHDTKDYKLQNVFTPPKKIERETTVGLLQDVVASKDAKAKEKAEREARRKNHEEYMTAMKSFETKVIGFQKQMHDVLADAQWEVKEEAVLETPQYYLNKQKSVMSLANTEFKTEQVGITLIPAQAIAEFAVAAELVRMQALEYSKLREELEKSNMPEYRLSLKEPQIRALQLIQVEKNIASSRNAIIKDLGNLDSLRLRYKKRYLKAALINPVLHGLVDRYPNIFSDDLAKQQEQVEIFNKAVTLGLTANEIKRLLADKQLDLDITTEHLAEVGRFNELVGEIFASQITDRVAVLQFLTTNGLAVPAAAIENLIALDRNTPAIVARPQVLAAKKELSEIRRDAASFKHTMTLHENRNKISSKEYSLDKDVENPVDYANQLDDLIETIHSVLSFNHDACSVRLKALRAFFEKAPDANEQLREVDSLIAFINDDKIFTAAERGDANSILGFDQQGDQTKPNKLKVYYEKLLKYVNKIDDEIHLDHHKFTVARKIQNETNLEKLQSVEVTYEKIKMLLAELTAAVNALQFASTLPVNDISHQYYDQLVALKDKLIQQHQPRLATYEGEGGRLAVAKNRIQELEKLEIIKQQQKTDELRVAKFASLEQIKTRLESLDSQIQVTEQDSLLSLQAETNKYTAVLISITEQAQTLQTELDALGHGQDPLLRHAYSENLELILKKQKELKNSLEQIKALTDIHTANELHSLADIDKALRTYQTIARKVSVAVATVIEYAKVNDFNLLPLLKELLQSKVPNATYLAILEKNKFSLGFGKKAIPQYLKKIANLLAQLPNLQPIEDKLALIHDQDTRQQREVIAHLKTLADTSNIEALSKEHEESVAGQNVHKVFANNELLCKVLMAKGLIGVLADLNLMRDALRTVPTTKLPGEELIPTTAITYRQFKAKYSNLPPLSEAIFNSIRAVEQEQVLAEAQESPRNFQSLEAAVIKTTQEMNELCLRFSILDFSKDRQVLRQAKLVMNNHDEIAKMRNFIGKFSDQVKAYTVQGQRFKELYVVQQRLKLIAKGRNQALPANANTIDAMLSDQQANLKSIYEYNQSWIKYLNNKTTNAAEKAQELLAPKAKKKSVRDDFLKVKNQLEYMQDLLGLLPMINNENHDNHVGLLKHLNISESLARVVLDKFLQIQNLIGALNKEKDRLAEMVEQEPLWVVAGEKSSHEAKRASTPARPVVESKRKQHEEKVPLLAGLDNDSVDFKAVSQDSKKESKADFKQAVKPEQMKTPEYEQPVFSTQLLQTLNTTKAQESKTMPVAEMKRAASISLPPVQTIIPNVPEGKLETKYAANPVEVAITHKGNQITTDYVRKMLVATFKGDGKDVAQNAALIFMKFNEKVGYLQHEDERVCRKAAIWIYAANNVNNILMNKQESKLLYITYKEGKNLVNKVYDPKAKYSQFFGFLYDDVKEIQEKTDEILQAIRQNKDSKYSAPTKTIEPVEQNRLNAANVQQVMRVR